MSDVDSKTRRETKKILVTLDGSEKSNDALDYALNLNKKLGAEMVLFSVHQNTVYPWIGPGYGYAASVNSSYMTEFYSDQKQYTQTILDDAQKRAQKKEPNFTVTTKMAEGGPSNKIVEEGLDGYDLIIMGSRGHGFIEELFLGSVSRRVVDDSTVPVLVVK